MTKKSWNDASIEYCRLEVMRDGIKFLKKRTKPGIWHNEDVLIDKVQYHKTKKNTDYKVYVRSITTYGFDVVLVRSNRKEEEIIGASINVKWPDLEKNIQDMWSGAQHLMIDDFDGQNVMWTKHDFIAWWEKRENTTFIKDYKFEERIKDYV